MTKREINSIEKVKKEYLLKMCSAGEVFRLPPHEYERLDESTKRTADRQTVYPKLIFEIIGGKMLCLKTEVKHTDVC